MLTTSSAPHGRQIYPWQDLLCGAVAGMSSRLIVAPLDVVKIRFQVQSETQGRYHYTSVAGAFRSIVRHEGVGALWKGNVPALLMVAPYAGLQLSVFYQLKHSSLNTMPDTAASLTFGAIAATFATVVTYPLDLLRTRLAAQPEPKKYLNLSHAVTSIMRGEGVRGLYIGLQPTLVEIVPYMALNFVLYESVKQRTLQTYNTQRLKPSQSALIGAYAGTFAKLVTLPLDNAKKVLQVQGQFLQPEQVHYRGMFHVLHTLWSSQGITALFRGAQPSILKAAPSSAVTFMVYESAKNYFAST